MPLNQDVTNQWAAAAPYWEKHRDLIGQMFAPVTQALIQDANLSKEHAILDIATGPGDPALSVAAMLGPNGRVVGIDSVPEMVAAARRAATRLGLANARFETAFAGHLPLPAETFDAVISRFGVMFFPSPLDAVREMLRVLKPGAKLALAVWNFADTNPFFRKLSQVMDRYIEPAPLPPDAPDAFRFATPGKLLAVLTEAGVAAPAERLLKFTMQVPVAVEEFWTLRAEMSDKLREKITLLSPHQLTEVQRQVFDAVAEYATPTGMSFPAEVRIVSGTKESA